MKMQVFSGLFLIGLLSCAHCGPCACANTNFSVLPYENMVEESDIQWQQGVDLSAQGLCAFHIACGNIHLTNHKFVLALEEFEKGAMVLEQSGCFFPEMEFFISFGKVIAYDNLCLESETKIQVDNLICILHACEMGTNESADTGDFYLGEYDEATESLRKLAGLARTTDVREMLLAIVNETYSELMNFSDNYYDSTRYSQSESSFMHKDCGIFKRAKRIARKIYKICTIIIRIIDLLEKLDSAVTGVSGAK